ncbi:DNA primase [Loigolactobacillus backii]|uniref:DNA primase n=1 Tax=Loigolactobacillus backii TaxID=375175 RepID=UPI0007F113E7|nr:DNA primase [Loigolactobacillus backii]ANK59591.1 DNA primase [Loigolactobacillus backii]ANK67019.1 DNA primase [Loigolactobacillus backii]OLF70735.1 DNA primase [Loigolactobacillus backii]PIO87663.1 DNA primase [Loigolactobacillus backii]
MAGRIPEEVVEEVRTSVNITDIVGQYVQLKKSGKNLFGLCPFHEERTPSFSVTEDKQIFHCFSCGRGGNVFKFIMEIENLDFPAAVTKVAELGNVSVDLSTYQAKPQRPVDPKREKLFALYSDATVLYHHILVNTDTGEAALAYATQRNLNTTLLDTFQIGFAPQQRDLLITFFKEKQTDFQLLRQSGLFIENDDGTLRDRFVGRLMFPIRDEQGRVIAFSGRILQVAENQPKYLNSPETDLFNKRDVLFNFDLAKSEIRKAKRVILFEGFMDVIAAFQAGVKNGVASMGTSLTNEQLYHLRRATDQLVVCYDGDAPGMKATNRVIELLKDDQRFNLSIVTLPEHLDPDEYVKKYGSEQFQNEVTNSLETAPAFRLHFLKQNRNLDNEQDKIAYINDALQELVLVPSAVERDVYLNQLSEELHVSYTALVQQLQQLLKKTTAEHDRVRAQQQPKKEVVPVYQQQVHKLDRVELAERELLRLYFHDPTVRMRLRNRTNFSFIHDNYQLLYTFGEGYFEKHDSFLIAEFMDYLPSSDDRLQRLVSAVEQMAVPPTTSDEQVTDYLIAMRRSVFEKQLQKAQNDLRDAARTGDDKQAVQLLQRIIDLKRQIQEVATQQMI